MASDVKTIPLFPLNTVLFPGGPLPLRIFEPRYLDMISQCMKTGDLFGVCLIKEGRETGMAAEVHPVGTLARIVDWEDMEPGVLGVTVVGEGRFRIRSKNVERNKLVTAEVETMEEEESIQVPDFFFPQITFLQQMVQSLNQLYRYVPCNFEEAAWVSYRLAEFLPLTLQDKQMMLEVEMASDRLKKLMPWLEKIKWA